MKRALIGYTGFVGSTLCGQTSFDDCYNSSNIEQIVGKTFDLLICAGAPAAKWKANQNAEQDLLNIQRLITCLQTVQAHRFVLISTVDVYPVPSFVNESSTISAVQAEPYGKHRYYLEEVLRQIFPLSSIVRLPGLFGKGLKKNFIFDLLHNNCLHLTHAESIFQFYNLERLWADLQVVLTHQLALINFATAPVKAREVAAQCFAYDFANQTDRPPVRYNMQSQYAHLFGAKMRYLYSAEETFVQIRQFAQQGQKATTV